MGRSRTYTYVLHGEISVRKEIVLGAMKSREFKEHFRNNPNIKVWRIWAQTRTGEEYLNRQARRCGYDNCDFAKVEILENDSRLVYRTEYKTVAPIEEY